MAKKRPSKKRPKPPLSHGPAPVGDHPDEVFDRRVAEGGFRKFIEEQCGKPPETPLTRAQEVMDQAFKTSDRRKREALARKALEVSADCADAYVVLAELSENRKETLELYRQGMEAGERALGPDFFRENEGHFWLIMESRPYMRARLGFAELLWSMGHRDEAIAHLEAMLKLNPGDNQGLRYILEGWYLNLDRFDDLRRLLDRYDEVSAAWAYTRALLEFRCEGEGPKTQKLLKKALRVNKYVPDFLLGNSPMPSSSPPYYSYGDENEAILYVASAIGGWKATPGAMAWLRSAMPKSKTRKPHAPKGRGPLPTVLKRLERLPQERDVWQVGIHALRGAVEMAGERVHPMLLVVLSATQRLVCAQDIVEEFPAANWIWDQIANAIQKPISGKPHRPTILQVLPGEVWDELTPHLNQIGVEVQPVERLEAFDSLIEALEHDLGLQQSPGLLEMPGVEPDQVARFYQAAAHFYRKAPWRKLGFESVIQVLCDRLESGPRYAIVMGQSGLTFGLTLYDDLALLKRVLTSRMSDEENARVSVALTVTFDDRSSLSDADLDAIQQHGWEVASPEAYPSIFRKERGMSIRPPLGWEIDLMQACLRLIPEFIDLRPVDDLTPYEETVPATSGPLRLTLNWVEI